MKKNQVLSKQTRIQLKNLKESGYSFNSIYKNTGINRRTLKNILERKHKHVWVKTQKAINDFYQQQEGLKMVQDEKDSFAWLKSAIIIVWIIGAIIAFLFFSLGNN